MLKRILFGVSIHIARKYYLSFVKLLILVLCALLSVCAFGQVNHDSLWGVWNDKEQADSNRLRAIGKIAFDLMRDNPDSCILLANQQHELAKKTNNGWALASSLNNIGGAYMSKGMLDTASMILSRSITAYEKINDKSGAARALANIAIAKIQSGLLDEAIEHFNEVITIKKQLKQRESLADTYNNIASVYLYKGNIPTAIGFFAKAMKIDHEYNNVSGLASSYNNLGSVYMYMQDYDVSMSYYKKGYALADSMGLLSLKADCRANIGTAYLKQGKYQKAISHIREGIILDKLIGNTQGSDENYINLSTCLVMLGKLDEAIDTINIVLPRLIENENKRAQSVVYSLLGKISKKKGESDKGLKWCKKGLEIATALAIREEEKLNCECLSALYEDIGNYEEALIYYKQYIAVRDSLVNDRNTREVTQREMQYDFDKLQEKEQAEQEKKDAIVTEELKREKAIGYAFMGGFGLLLVLAFVVFRSLQQKKRANKLISEQKQEVEHQKELVEEKNREITDSITYAKRIQEAILPPDRLVKEFLKESFILYKPKDIVAGDFYWMESVDNLVIFAAADCTGHGVPGAMVSVVCHNAMNRAVREFGLNKPAEILDKTNELVEETFEKSESEVKDGMDIALCCLDLKNNSFEYAGANNPLYYINNGEVKEIKGNKQPIGKHEGRQPFTNHTLEINKGDCYYIFSDGFADQFGGAKGKKFKYKPFRELLLANHSKPMEEQRKILDEALESWRGELEQVDDICIIGVRI